MSEQIESIEAMAERDEEKETARIEAFSDGVFAIAITLLILEVKVPHPGQEGSLWSALTHQWTTWLAFLASFFTIGVMWVNHHRLFTLIRRSDDRLLLRNGLLLLAVTIVPYPTSLLAQYVRTDESRLAATIYSVHGLLIALAYTGLFRYAVRGRLLGKRISLAAAEDIARQYRFGPFLYLIAIALAQWNGIATLIFALGLAMFFALPPAALRHPGHASR